MMMHMTGVLVVMMVFLTLLVVGVLFGMRALGAHEVKDDHPR